VPFLQKGLTVHMAKRFSHSRFFRMDPEALASRSRPACRPVLNILLNKPIGYTAKDIPTLRLMSCSTAPLTAQQWTQFEEMYGVTLLQMYGMSETGWICGNRPLRQEDGHGRPAGAASGIDDRRRAAKNAARRRRRDHGRRPADGDRLSARRRLDRSRCSASASRPATSASRKPKASSASPAAPRT
jgi:hypothetical protein